MVPMEKKPGALLTKTCGVLPSLSTAVGTVQSTLAPGRFSLAWIAMVDGQSEIVGMLVSPRAAGERDA